MSLHKNFIPINESQQDVKSFDCGHEGMNSFLSRFASKQMIRNISRTYVLPEKVEGICPGTNGKSPIAAYFTLKAHIVEKEGIPNLTGVPKHGLPVVLLAKFAVRKSLQNKGIGKKALIEALRQARDMAGPSSNGLPAIGVVIDVLNDSARKFYDSFGIFHEVRDCENRLFISMKDLEDL